MRDKDQILLEQLYISMYSVRPLTEADMDIENYILTEGLGFVDSIRGGVSKVKQTVTKFLNSGVGTNAQKYFVNLLLAATLFQVPSFIQLANSPEQEAMYGKAAVEARTKFQNATSQTTSGEQINNVQLATVVFNDITQSKKLTEDQKAEKLAQLIEAAKKSPEAFIQLANQIINELKTY